MYKFEETFFLTLDKRLQKALKVKHGKGEVQDLKQIAAVIIVRNKVSTYRIGKIVGITHGTIIYRAKIGEQRILTDKNFKNAFFSFNNSAGNSL